MPEELYAREAFACQVPQKDRFAEIMSDIRRIF